MSISIYIYVFIHKQHTYIIMIETDNKEKIAGKQNKFGQ